jgi:hypothetical protein
MRNFNLAGRLRYIHVDGQVSPYPEEIVWGRFGLINNSMRAIQALIKSNLKQSKRSLKSNLKQSERSLK